MALEFSAVFSAKDKGLKAFLTSILAQKKQITDDTWNVKLFGNKDEISEVQSALSRFENTDLKLNIQASYDTVFANLEAAFDSYKSKFSFYELFEKSKQDTGLSDYLRTMMAEIDDAIYEGADPTKFIDKYKEIANIIESARVGKEFTLDNDTIREFDEFKLQFTDVRDLKKFNPITTFMSNFRQELEKDQDALLTLGNYLNTTINAGATPKAANDLVEIADKLEVVSEKVSQTDKVTIFDGVSEQTYDVIKDFDALIAKLEEMAEKMKTPVFQAGDLRRGIVNSEDFIPAEALKRDLITGNASSPGTGHYFASNLVDAIEWLNKSGGQDFERGLFAIDLNKYKNLLKIPSADYYTELTEAFSNIHNLIAEGIIEPQSGKSYADKLDNKDAAGVFDQYKEFFTDLGVNAQQFQEFIIEERGKLKDLVSSSASLDDALDSVKKEDAFGTRFLKRFTKYEGIDATNLDLDDSTALGNVVFSLDKSHPFDINFGGNEEIARTFYSMILEKVLAKKVQNANNESNVKELFESYIDNTQQELLKSSDIDRIKASLEKSKAQRQEYTYKDLNAIDSTSGQSGVDQILEETKETEVNTKATEENTEAHRENQELKQKSVTPGKQEADTEATRENTTETEKNTEAQKKNKEAKEDSAQTSRQGAQTEATREDTSETEKNTQAHKENREAKESTGQADQASSHTQQTKEDTEETEKNTQAQRENREERERAAETVTGSAQMSSSDINEESNAFNQLGAAAILAASNKEKFTNANISLASQIRGSSIPAIEKETTALKDLASAAQNAASAKKEYSKGESSKSKDTGSTTNTAEKAKAEAEEQAAELQKRINRLASGYGDYYKNIQMSATGIGGKAVNNLISGYETEVTSVTSAVEKLNSAWGEQSDKVKEVKQSLDGFLNKSAALTATDIQGIAQRQIDKIDRSIAVRKQQGPGYNEAYLNKLQEARQVAVEIKKAAGDLDFSKSFDSSNISKWIQDLEKGRITIKEVNDQIHILATEGQLNKLLGKINGDIAKGGLRGSLADEYDNLQQKVRDALTAINECTSAEEAASKVDFRNLNAEYERLKANAKETGQLADGFVSKFANAINNQSAQFLATYFSFQDIIRYSKQIAQTVIGTDSALTELKKVSDASNDRIQQSFQKSAETAQELGSTITEVINSTSDWARLNNRSVIW